MHYEISYKGLDRALADSKAVGDIQEYLGATAYTELVVYAQAIANTPKAEWPGYVKSLNMTLGLMAGVTGYPFHAFCRRYCLAAYREWMHAEPDPVLTDAEGFELPKVAA